jgi:hypothetical protein
MAAPEKKVSDWPPQWLRRGLAASPEEASRAAELQVKEVETARAELEVQKLATEVARGPLEKQLLEVRIQEGLAEIARRRAETRSLDDAGFRADVYLILALLLIILILALAVVDPQLLKIVGRALYGVSR